MLYMCMLWAGTGSSCINTRARFDLYCTARWNISRNQNKKNTCGKDSYFVMLVAWGLRLCSAKVPASIYFTFVRPCLHVCFIKTLKQDPVSPFVTCDIRANCSVRQCMGRRYLRFFAFSALIRKCRPCKWYTGILDTFIYQYNVPLKRVPWQMCD